MVQRYDGCRCGGPPDSGCIGYARPKALAQRYVAVVLGSFPEEPPGRGAYLLAAFNHHEAVFAWACSASYSHGVLMVGWCRGWMLASAARAGTVEGCNGLL
jgi:hypothetical protein